MSRVFWGGAVLMVHLAMPAVSLADSLYTDFAAWQAAAAGRGAVTGVSLTPFEVPLAGAAVVDDELTLTFGENHGGIRVFEDGWAGDVHQRQGSFSPGPNLVAFARPVYAFSATVAVGFDVGLVADSIIADIGGNSYRLMRDGYGVPAPAFFGWIGDAPVSSMTIRSGAVNHSYSMRDVHYATSAVWPAASESPAVVPLPPAAWSGVVLLAGLGLAKRFLKHGTAATREC